jgi:hypothetical protein
MNGENRLLVAHEPDEFKKYPVRVQDFREITDGFRTIYGDNFKISKKENRKMSTCNRLDLETLGT